MSSKKQSSNKKIGMSRKKQSSNKKIGIISHITSTKKLIVPSQQTPKIGSLIVNKNNKPIGKISDIFGSTKKPYLAIKTNYKFKKATPGEDVYLQYKKKNRRRKQWQS